MRLTETLVFAVSLHASLVFAADLFARPLELDLEQPGTPGVRDYSCSVVQDEVVCDQDRTLIASR